MLPIYRSWDDVARAGLCTKTQARRERLVLPNDAKPVAVFAAYWPGYWNMVIHTYLLYLRADAVSLKTRKVTG